MYEALLEVQEECLKLVASHISLENLYTEMIGMIGMQLRRLGITKAEPSSLELKSVYRAFI